MKDTGAFMTAYRTTLVIVQYPSLLELRVFVCRLSEACGCVRVWQTLAGRLGRKYGEAHYSNAEGEGPPRTHAAQTGVLHNSVDPYGCSCARAFAIVLEARDRLDLIRVSLKSGAARLGRERARLEGTVHYQFGHGKLEVAAVRNPSSCHSGTSVFSTT